MEDEAEIRRQILQLEFQHKKDMAEMRETQKKDMAEIRKLEAKIDQRLDYVGRHLEHISQLTGYAFEEIRDVDDRLVSASNSLASKKKP